MTRIFVDLRERDLLPSLKDVGEVVAIAMEAGDYAVVTAERAVLIERKSFRDFVSSYRNGRLWEQLVRMLALDRFDDVPVGRRMLIVEMAGPELEEMPRLEASVLGAQMECVYTYHVPIFFLEGRGSVERFLRVLAAREEEGRNDKPIPARWYRPRFPRELPRKDQRAYFLCSIPGVGEHLASQLMERYESVDTLCQATVKDLEQVPGFGKKRAQRLHEFLH